MTKFEKFLLNKGYMMFAFNAKEMKYYKPQSHIISTMVNLGHTYIHSSDTNLLGKIEREDNNITWEDRKNEIRFGLNEKDKPTTLIYPRPRIEVIKEENGYRKVINEKLDDAVNIVFAKIDFETILTAMFDKTKLIEIKL